VDIARNADLARTSVYQQLRSDILCCVLQPGCEIKERELAERFAVSKSPIRDALLRLEENGLIDVLPRKGYRVRSIDVADVHEMYEIRHIYERECILRVMDTASDKLLAELKSFRESPSNPDLRTWLEYNRRFHSYFAINCGNARLSRSALDMIEQFDRLTYVSVTSNGAPNLSQNVREHGAIIDGVLQRNRREAVSRMRSHIETSRRRVIERLESLPVVTTRSRRN